MSESIVPTSDTTSQYTSPTGGLGGWVGNPNPTGQGSSTKSTLYLFTFLIVLVILAVISAALLFRAYYIRRRFRQRIQTAIANGQALPPDALAGLGVIRPTARKGEKDVGPMPIMWEATMYKDEIEEDGSRRASMIGKDLTTDITEKEVGDEDDWRDLTPVGMIYYPSGEPKTYPPPPQPPVMGEQMPRRQMLRSLFRPDNSDPIAYIRQQELNRLKAEEEVKSTQISYQVPEKGSEVVVGVMIAFPSQEGGSERWSVNSGDMEEGQQVPDVCLGIMEATIGDKKRR